MNVVLLGISTSQMIGFVIAASWVCTLAVLFWKKYSTGFTSAVRPLVVLADGRVVGPIDLEPGHWQTICGQSPSRAPPTFCSKLLVDRAWGLSRVLVDRSIGTSTKSTD